MAAAGAVKQVVAVESAEEAAQAILNRRVKVKPSAQPGRYQPVITALTVVLIVRFLHAWLVENRPTPKVREFYAFAVLGFVLSLMTDVSPKLGKGFSYLILTGVVFGGTQEIWEAVKQEEEKPETVPGATGPGSAPGTGNLQLASVGTPNRQVLRISTGPAERTPYYSGERVQPFNDPQRPRSNPTQTPYGGTLA